MIIVDIDVCLTLNETCYDENAHCVNTEGSFTCQCNSGFTGEGYNCSGTCRVYLGNFLQRSLTPCVCVILTE